MYKNNNINTVDDWQDYKNWTSFSNPDKCQTPHYTTPTTIHKAESSYC